MFVRWFSDHQGQTLLETEANARDRTPAQKRRKQSPTISSTIHISSTILSSADADARPTLTTAISFCQTCNKRKGTVSATHSGCSRDEASCTCDETVDASANATDVLGIETVTPVPTQTVPPVQAVPLTTRAPPVPAVLLTTRAPPVSRGDCWVCETPVLSNAPRQSHCGVYFHVRCSRLLQSTNGYPDTLLAVQAQLCAEILQSKSSDKVLPRVTRPALSQLEPNESQATKRPCLVQHSPTNSSLFEPQPTNLVDVDTVDDAEASLWAILLTGASNTMLASVVSDSMIDAGGNRLYFLSNEARAANAATRLPKTRMQLCPICCCPCHNAAKKCNTCTFAFKLAKGPRYQGKVTVARDSDANRNEQAIERIKAQYFRTVDVKQVQLVMSSVHRNPCSKIDLYVFDEHTSADRLHCIPHNKVEMVLNHPDGLSPYFACLAPMQRIRAVWFRECTISEVAKGVKHTIDKHLKHNSNKTVYGFVVKQGHAASRLIVPAKHNHQYYSMVAVPTSELILVKLN